jgi:hypothetical protein
VGKEGDESTLRSHEQFGYKYDAAGNLDSRTNNALIQGFSVNALNQLTNVSRATTNQTVAGFVTTNASVTVNGSGATVYSDLTFARAGVGLVNGTNTFTALASDSAGRSDSDSVSVNLPSSVNLLYDRNGNLTNDGLRSFQYDADDQLTLVQGSNWRSEFVYDALRRRRITREYTGGGLVDAPLVTGVTLSSNVRSNFTGWVGFKFTVGPNDRGEFTKLCEIRVLRQQIVRAGRPNGTDEAAVLPRTGRI